jgi:hypothetical protein
VVVTLTAMELIPTVTADGRIIFRATILTPRERWRRLVRKLRVR